MVRRIVVSTLALLLLISVLLATMLHPAWWVAVAVVTALSAVTLFDVLQSEHSLLRNYPLLAHARYALEGLRPEMQQYFIERNYDGKPFDRDTRTVIYERAKGIHPAKAFGTERDVNAIGYEYFVHSSAPVHASAVPQRITVGSEQCERPYNLSVLNISAMSYGALSPNAVLAMNRGAQLGGFAQDTGEGGISRYHLEGGGDLIWEIGSGYFGARDESGRFDPVRFRERSSAPAVKMVSLKVSQGAKPGLGGVLPGAKVTQWIAAARGVPVGTDCISPAAHSAFSTPRELVRFVGQLRDLSGGKPAGFKLCVGSRAEFLAICKAIRAEGIYPDFIIIDGSEGGTGAAPLEYSDHVGTPLTEGLLIAHNALVGTGLRHQIRLGAAGKVALGSDICKRLIQGADFTMAARAMMMATGCIQAQACHTNRCPVGVATQDPARYRAVHVDDKAERVARYHAGTVAEAMQMFASMGVHDHHDLHPDLLRRRVSQTTTVAYSQLFDWLDDGELLTAPPTEWAEDWQRADPDTFTIARSTLR
ncbi:MAG: FMN-binding glutamate synthase family protein [Cumulibacter sp.]